MSFGYLSRGVAAGSLSVTGIGLGGLVLREFAGAGPGGGTAGLLIAGFGLVLGLGFVVGGVVLYRSDIATVHTLRVAGWNALGIVATASILAVVWFYQQATGGMVVAPAFSVALVVGVSSFAHVLIGVNDVRRIRAEELAEQHRQAAVVNRFVRHNLKHTAQYLIGWGDQLQSVPESERVVDLGESITAKGRELGDVSEQVQTITRLMDSPGTDRNHVDLDEILREVVNEFDEEYPEATIERTGESATVLARPEIATAFGELLENALVHGDGPVTIDCATTGGRATISIEDQGEGIPDTQRALVHENRLETQLEHGHGLGLWLARWIVDASGGTLGLPDVEAGAMVTVELDIAP